MENYELYKWFIIQTPVMQALYAGLFTWGLTALGAALVFYTKDFQSFIEYNIQDVEIVDGLEDKLGLIDLSLTVAYESKVNYGDIFSQVRVWDTLIANHLMKRKICVPPREEHIKDQSMRVLM